MDAWSGTPIGPYLLRELLAEKVRENYRLMKQQSAISTWLLFGMEAIDPLDWVVE